MDGDNLRNDQQRRERDLGHPSGTLLFVVVVLLL
jgi:hypothetical protein